MNKKTVLSYSAGYFIAVIVISVVLWAFAFDNITAPKKYQTLNLFITAEKCNVTLIEEKLSEIDGVKRVNAVSSSEKSNYYGEQLSTIGLINSDVLILNLASMPEKNLDVQFAPLDGDVIKRYGLNAEDYTFFAMEDRNFGIIVYDKENGIDLFDGIIEFDENEKFVLCLSSYRPNAVTNGTVKNTSDNAYTALSVLLSLSR